MRAFLTLTAGGFLAIFALPAWAETHYDLIAKNCGNPGSDSSLTISDDAISFYESSCAITGRKAVSDSVSDVVVSCEGEGESWTREMRLETTATGLRLSDDDGATDYVTCD